MITCFLRYTINPDKLADFEHYARVWMGLIEKYGGTHHGYFVPAKIHRQRHSVFPGIGEAGPDNVAVALFSFPSVEAYETYRAAQLLTIPNVSPSRTIMNRPVASLSTSAPL